MAELPLNRCDILGFFDQMLAHGMPGIKERVTLEASQVAHFTEDRIDHPEVETTIAVTVGILKLIDFILYFQDNAQSSAQKNFPIHRLID